MIQQVNINGSCGVEGCTHVVHAKGLCQRHYTIQWRLLCEKRDVRCKVDGCRNAIHAKDYCRKHYTQVWRKGQISCGTPYSRFRENQGDAQERICVLMRELEKIQEMYNNVVGFENRTRWRKEITAIQVELTHVKKASGLSLEAAAV